MKPPFAPPEPRLLANVCVDWPNSGFVRLLLGIEPYYPKEGNGRPPVGLSMMLRIYFVQHWFNLSNPAAEEPLYDSPALRRFAGVDLGCAPVPDETTNRRSRRGGQPRGRAVRIFKTRALVQTAAGVGLKTGPWR